MKLQVATGQEMNHSDLSVLTTDIANIQNHFENFPRTILCKIYNMYSEDMNVLLHSSLKTMNQMKPSVKNHKDVVGWTDIYDSQTVLYSQVSVLLSRKDSADY